MLVPSATRVTTLDCATVRPGGIPPRGTNDARGALRGAAGGMGELTRLGGVLIAACTAATIAFDCAVVAPFVGVVVLFLFCVVFVLELVELDIELKENCGVLSAMTD